MNRRQRGPRHPTRFRSFHERSCSLRAGIFLRASGAAAELHLPDSDHPGDRGDFGADSGSRLDRHARRRAATEGERPARLAQNAAVSQRQRSQPLGHRPGPGRARHLRHRRRDSRARLGHDRHGQARRQRRAGAFVFQQAAAISHADGRPLLADLSHDRRDAGRASVPDRPIAAVAVHRAAAGRLFFRFGRAGRSLGHDRLGTHFHRGVRHVRDVSDDVCRLGQQPCSGRGMRRRSRSVGWCESFTTASSNRAGLPYAAYSPHSRPPTSCRLCRFWCWWAWRFGTGTPADAGGFFAGGAGRRGGPFRDELSGSRRAARALRPLERLVPIHV